MKKFYIAIATFAIVALSGLTLVFAQEEREIAQHLQDHQGAITTQTFEYGKESVLVYDTDTFELIDGNLEIDTSKPHEGSVELIMLDIELEREYEYTYPYAVIDTVAPELHNLKDITMTLGGDSRPNVSATDAVDGDLEVVYGAEVDYEKVGVTKVTVEAVDTNGNKTTGEFTVTINPKPKPKETITKTVTEKRVPKPLGRQSIRFDQTGDVIPYANAGMDGGMKHIDKHRWDATTWEIIGNKTHSNTDGQPTYLAAHVTEGFRNLPKLKMGTTITIVDGNGHTQKYKIESSQYLDVQDSGQDDRTVTPVDQSTMDKVFAFKGEGIVLQTCNPAHLDTSVYLVFARPI